MQTQNTVFLSDNYQGIILELDVRDTNTILSIYVRSQHVAWLLMAPTHHVIFTPFFLKFLNKSCAFYVSLEYVCRGQWNMCIK